MANRNPNQNRWNLTIAQHRPDSPLGSTGGGLICHHALPYNRWRDFGNRAWRSTLDDFRGTSLRRFVQALRRYPVGPGYPGAAEGFTPAVAAVLDQVEQILFLGVQLRQPLHQMIVHQLAAAVFSASTSRTPPRTAPATAGFCNAAAPCASPLDLTSRARARAAAQCRFSCRWY